MELNAVVLSKRGGNVTEKDMRFNFERVLHIVDSETILNMINETSTRFKLYEGVRIGEGHAAKNDVSYKVPTRRKLGPQIWATEERTTPRREKDL